MEEMEYEFGCKIMPFLRPSQIFCANNQHICPRQPFLGLNLKASSEEKTTYPKTFLQVRNKPAHIEPTFAPEITNKGFPNPK